MTEAEHRRAEWNAAHPAEKVSPVALLVWAMARALVEHPKFNTSFGSDCKTFVQKRYVNLGVAVDTPRGPLVPVLKGVLSKSVQTIASELGAVADRARSKGLSMSEMSGGSMTLSSLGHIGGTAFTPIINAPEVAVLGALAIQLRLAPTTDGGRAWRKKLPLSLSYDHRVINGADAARFTNSIGVLLSEPHLFG